MKKLNKIFATMFALALIFALPSQTMTAHAQGFVGDWEGYAILIREELAAQNKNKQNRDTISRQFS